MKNNYTEWVSNIDKAFYFLLDVSNANENKYMLKEFHTHTIGFIGGVAGERTSGMLEGSIWVIADIDVLSNISNQRKFYGAEFSHTVDSILNDGYSLVVITNNYYENHALPRDINDQVDVHEFLVNNFALNKLRCYTYDDELGKAVNMFDAYMKVYGGNISDIPVDKMISDAKKIPNPNIKVLK